MGSIMPFIYLFHTSEYTYTTILTSHCTALHTMHREMGVHEEGCGYSVCSAYCSVACNMMSRRMLMDLKPNARY